MILHSIFIATVVGGVVSVALAALISLSWLPRFSDRLVAFSVGLLLTFAFTNLLPEAIHLGLNAATVGKVVLGGLLMFFLLEKASLWRHDHHQDPKSAHPPRVAMIVLGDGLHNAVDGVLIAAAFLTDPMLGWATAVTVAAHEIPQEVSDFVLLLASGLSRTRALALNALSGCATVVGGVAGYVALSDAEAAVPYVLAVSAASFIYIAMADLVPELHRQRTTADAVSQAALMTFGVLVMLGVTALAPHAH